VFGLLGLGGATFTAAVGQYRQAFFALTFVALAISFYLNYIKSQSTTTSRIIFWISAIGALAAMGYAYFPN
jgi:uncharacterized membrane protein (DUF4010 family)